MDFNAVKFIDERKQKALPSQSSMDDFNNMVSRVNLIEFSYKGSWFLWDNHQLGNDFILSKIDGGFCNEATLKFCANSWIEILPTTVVIIGS